jgi:hemerythrin-like domain-containing protein
MIESQKKEHSKIRNAFNNINKFKLDSKEGREALLSAKELILKHLEKEDKEFYHAIREAAKHNQELKELLNEFEKDMDHISSYVIGFFDGYSLFNNKDTVASIEKLVEILKRRMLREDNILFPKYEKLQEKST